jgi:hypothetical protein
MVKPAIRKMKLEVPEWRRPTAASLLYLRSSLCFCLVLFVLPVLANAATNYVLTNGVITLSARPPEPLTGSFTLAEGVTLSSPHGEVRFFELLGLELQSASVSFILRTGGVVFMPNGEGASTVPFLAVVNATGLPFETVRLRSSDEGDAFHISIWDTNETQQLGTMSFSAVAVPVPRLSISQPDSASIQIAWATNFTDYRLEVATTLPAAMWEPVTNGVAIEGDRFKVNLPTDGAQRLYRLRKQ